MLVERLQECVDSDPRALGALAMMVGTINGSPEEILVRTIQYLDVFLIRYPLPGWALQNLFRKCGGDPLYLRELADRLLLDLGDVSPILAAAEDLTDFSQPPKYSP